MSRGGIKDTRSREERRRDTAEDFTPPWLVKEMLDEADSKVWESEDTIFLDPSCGDGNFLVALKERLMSCGHSEKDAVSRVFGIDIIHSNVVTACERMGIPHNPEEEFAVSPTIVCADTVANAGRLEELFEMAEKQFYEGRNEELQEALRELLKSVKPVLKAAERNDETKKAIQAYKQARKQLD